MSYANRKQMGSNRTAAVIVVALLHVALGYALVTGLAYNVVKKAAEDLKTFDVSEPPPPPEKPPPPPPKDLDTPPPPVVAPPPMVRINNAPSAQVNVSPVIPPPAPAPIITPPPPPTPPPAPRRVQPAQARGNLNALFSTDDYPASALRNEEQGTTGVRLTIGSDGKVADCSVTSSSGSASLDAATCNIIRRRARYTPARDDTGSTTTGSDSARIRWVVPSE